MDLTNALWITLIGMGLVFVAILALWGLMALLVRLTPEQAAEEGNADIPVELSPEASAPTDTVSEGTSQDRKRRAAAAAVAVALAQARMMASTPARESQSAGTLSPWQAVHRASQLSQRTQAMRKKEVR